MLHGPLETLVRHARAAAVMAALGATACAPGLHARSQAGMPVALGAVAAQEHVVQPGETMWRIARRYGVTVDELARHNGIEDPTRVRAGRVLAVPGEGPEGPATEASPTAPASPAPSARPGIADGPQAGTGTPPTAASPSRGLAPPARDVTTPAAPRSAPDGALSTPTSPPPAPAVAPPARSLRAPAKASPPPPAEGTPGYRLRWPVEGAIVARFGSRGGAPHDGIDIAVAAGTAVRAAASGKVVFSGRHGGYGNLVIVRHDDGLVTVYAHNSVNLVRKGQSVTGGDVLGRVGTASRTGSAQLHFEVREGVQARNPLKYLPP